VAWSVTFFSDQLEAEIRDLAPGFVARFIRYTERMEIYGPDLGMPHTRAMGGGLFVKKTDKTPPRELEIARRRMKEGHMTSSLKQFKRRALARPEVKAAYEASAEEFPFLDEVLRARAESGLTQAEVAKRVGTTQSAIARLESAEGKHSPSVATLQKYAKALGYRLELKLVKERRLTTRSSGRARGQRASRSGRAPLN
jgi:DNA-binding XRE family transcriptional regulator